MYMISVSNNRTRYMVTILVNKYILYSIRWLYPESMALLVPGWKWSESFFPKVFWIFQKWTFINVHFPKKSFRFEKNDAFVTQSIMLTFTFLSWFFCYDNFFFKNLRIYIGSKRSAFLYTKKMSKIPKNAGVF